MDRITICKSRWNRGKATSSRGRDGTWAQGLLDGVRAMLLPRAEDELTEMFGAKLALRPLLRPEMEPEVDLLGLPPADEALVFAPDYPEAHANRADALRRAGRLDVTREKSFACCAMMPPSWN